MLSSCFDCILLRDVPNRPDLKDKAYICGAYNHILSYDQARVPNECREKRQNDNIIQFPQNPILGNLYKSCVEFAYYIERPFTVRELVEHLGYLNKNSLWMLMEHLCMAGRLEKTDIRTENYRGQSYKAKVYFPVDWSVHDELSWPGQDMEPVLQRRNA